MFFGRKMDEELSKELELQIKGAEKPFYMETYRCPYCTPTFGL